MIYFVYRDPRFESSLNALREKGGTAMSAANKAEEIVQRVLMNGREHAHKVGRLTRRGELRIKYGIKYDLGSGYRLICAKKGSRLFLLYVGSHDDCDRWLDRNKGLQCETVDRCVPVLVTRKGSGADSQSRISMDPSDEYEEQLMRNIDDAVLRSIFCGLVEK